MPGAIKIQFLLTRAALSKSGWAATQFLLILALPLILLAANATGQDAKFTHQEILRGSITQERAWWDLKYYHLDIAVNPTNRTLQGQNTIRYQVIEPYQVMQVDLQNPMQITKVTQGNKPLRVRRDGNAWFVSLNKRQKRGAIEEIVVQFEGQPQISKNPPWSGGLTWQKDGNGKPWVVTTCQGDGASLWWPCKDHQADEPDSMLISVTVPEELISMLSGSSA